MDSASESVLVSGRTGDHRLVRKPIELICCAPHQSLSGVQRRILTAICDAVGRLEDADEVCMTPRELSLAIGNDGENLQGIHKASAAMRDLKAWLNPLEADSPPQSVGVFDEVSCSSDEILYRLCPQIGQLIRSGDCFAKVDPRIEKKLCTSNAVALYELSVLFSRRSKRPTFTAARWRQLITGSSTKENERFVTSQIIKRSGPALETHARVKAVVVRPDGPRVDRIRLEFRALDPHVGSYPTSKECRSQDPPDQALSEQVVTNEVAPASAESGVDAFEQLLGSWNSQFATLGRSELGQANSTGSSPSEPEATAPEDGQSDEVMDSLRLAQSETARLKHQLQQAEALEREAALRVLRSAVRRYRVTPGEVFGLPAQNDGFGASSAGRTSSADAGGELKWMN